MQKEIFLTFDDGPNEHTLKILNILKNFEAKATFFVCGKNLEKFPEIAEKVVEEKQSIGNHTYSHSINFLFPWNFKKEIEKTNQIIQRLTGERKKIFRPPWGILNPWLKRYLIRNDYKIILWDFDPKDWQGNSSKIIIKNFFKGVKEGSIVIFHDCLQTAIALPIILKKLKKENYIFKVF